MKKIVSSLFLGLFLLVLTVDGTSAASCTIADNGFLSHNWCRVRVSNSLKIKQINGASVTNVVNVSSNTGNTVKWNNDAGSTTSGNSTVNVSITNTLNANSLSF